MSLLDLVGWIGSAILVWSLLQSRILRLRLINLVGCVILIAFNLLAGVWPMVGLNVVLAVINVVYLQKMLRSRHSPATYSVVHTEPTAPYVQHLLSVHGADVERFAPAFRDAVVDATEAYLIVRGDETVGYVLLHDAGDGVAQIDLDYVTERYRDFTPGEFVFRRSDLLRDRGYTSVRTRAGSASTAPYYEKIGFTATGDAYELNLTRTTA